MPRKNYSEQECNQWLSDKNINPKTGRIIKKNGKLYKTIETACKIYSLSTFQYLCKVLGKCIKKVQYIRKFACGGIWGGTPCMIKGCSWTGRWGINFTALPTWITQKIVTFVPFNDGVCCCFCPGHLIMYMTFIFNVFIESFLTPNVYGVTKLQSLVDKLNISIDIDKQNDNTGYVRGYDELTHLNETIQEFFLTNYKIAQNEALRTLEPVGFISLFVETLYPYVDRNFIDNLRNLITEIGELIEG